MNLIRAIVHKNNCRIGTRTAQYEPIGVLDMRPITLP